ncbi:MAG TPA: glycosyltransferase, partial [Ignavibacteriaceae bacterium]|nr:glycosyltransferase [Ignavibacteriaceae bacterium]
MNVLHIVGGLPSEKKPYHHTFVKSQIDSLKKLSINVDVIDLEGNTSSLNYIKYTGKIKGELISKKIDLIHAHYSYCGLSALLTRTKIPIILSLMGSDLLGSADENGKVTLRGHFDKILSRYVSNHVDQIIVKSKQMADKLNLKVPVEVIPNGVDFTFFRPMDKIECRKKLKLDEKKFLILFLGNPQLNRKNFKLAKSSAEEFINQVGSSEAEFISPFGNSQEDIVLYLNACDVLLLTSYWEGSPNVIKEAIA